MDIDPSDATVLVVDDNPMDRALLIEHLSRDGYRIEAVCDGVEAWSYLENELKPVDVILLDRNMPRMDGMELLAKMKDDPRLSMLPVILETASGERESMMEGIRAGAYYYITKPYDPEMLLSIVGTAASDYARYKELRQELRKGVSGISLLQDGFFVFRSISEANDLGTILANTCPNPEKTVMGLTELLVNAVEHGNLGISYEEKSRLNESGSWLGEVTRRLALPENAAKCVKVRYQRNATEIRITIADEGPGFDFMKYLQVDPRRAFDTHGRGIAIANLLSFSRLEFHGTGNEVVGTIAL